MLVLVEVLFECLYTRVLQIQKRPIKVERGKIVGSQSTSRAAQDTSQDPRLDNRLPQWFLWLYRLYCGGSYRVGGEEVEQPRWVTTPTVNRCGDSGGVKILCERRDCE